MTFKTGDHVVYPHHGAGTVVSTLTPANGDLITIKLFNGELTISVPATKADAVGLRPVLDPNEWEDVFVTLRERDVRMPSNWSRRYKNHVEKLKTGEVFPVAEVVRNLAIRFALKGLSTGEKNLRLKARSILASELTLSLDIPLEEAERLIDEATEVET